LSWGADALPAEERLLDLLLGEAKHLFPACIWTAAGIGRHQAPVMDWALARGADAVRTGLEDNIRLTRDRLAVSNAEHWSCWPPRLCAAMAGASPPRARLA
jgi:3-keto-5-aminohexanoate cleavage enzyme